MKLVNPSLYPAAYLEAAKSHIYESKRGRIGITQLIDSPQIRNLWLDKYEEVVLDCDDFFTSMLGTAFHKYLEEHLPDKGQVAERKFEYEIEQGIMLVGKADVSGGSDTVIESKTIEDYKLMAAFSYVFDKTDYFEKQLNILRWLAWKVDRVVIEKLIIHIFIKDWTFYESQKNPDYPKSRYIRQEIKCWSFEETEKYVFERIALHKDKNYKCDDTDKWVKLEKWAVMKKGTEKAMRLLDTEEDAMNYISSKKLDVEYNKQNIYIVQRKTEAKRCMSFCNVRSVCPYAQSLRG